jgi:uncharacterized protein YpmS
LMTQKKVNEGNIQLNCLDLSQAHLELPEQIIIA